MSDEGSSPSGRAAPESLENQQLADRDTGHVSRAWSGLGPKPGQWVRTVPDGAGGWYGRTLVHSVSLVTGTFWRADGVEFKLSDRGKTWDFTVEDLTRMEAMVCPGCAAPAESLDGEWGLCPKCLQHRNERASLNDDPGATRGRAGVLDDVPAIPEPKRCKGLTEMNHAWECDAVLGSLDGDQCAHCQNLEAQIRAEDLAVEETERQDAEQAIAYEQLLKAHQGDARAVVIGVLRTMVKVGAVTEQEESLVHDATIDVVRDMFEQAEHLRGLPLMMFWSLLADVAVAERNFLRRGAVEAYRGLA